MEGRTDKVCYSDGHKRIERDNKNMTKKGNHKTFIHSKFLICLSIVYCSTADRQKGQSKYILHVHW